MKPLIVDYLLERASTRDFHAWQHAQITCRLRRALLWPPFGSRVMWSSSAMSSGRYRPWNGQRDVGIWHRTQLDRYITGVGDLDLEDLAQSSEVVGLRNCVFSGRNGKGSDRRLPYLCLADRRGEDKAWR